MKIFNTLTHQKEEFVPIHPGEVGIYACGPTVYNYFHIGNARPFIVFDTLRRYLEHKGYKVTFVQNFTDIDDKMIKRAAEENVSVAELGDKYIEEYFKDADALGVRRASVHPRATKHIGEIIGLIKKLENKGLAYAVNGDVYFDTQAYHHYGQLITQNLEDLEAGPASAWARPSAIPWISPSGRPRNRASPHGRAPGVWAGPAGISNARP